MTDRYGTLWIGTKGDGLICIPDYQKDFDGKSLFIYSPKGKLPLANYMRGPNFYPVFYLKRKIIAMISGWECLILYFIITLIRRID